MTKYGRNKFAQFSKPSVAPAEGISEIYFDPEKNGNPFLLRSDGTYSAMINSSTFYGSCATSAQTSAKTVLISDFELKTGIVVLIKFTNSNTADNPTLNVSGTGAKAMLYNGTELSDLRNDRVYEFVYDGTYYQCVCGVSSYSTVTDTTLVLGV